MSNDIGSEKFMEFFTTVMINSKFIERDPNDFAKCWHPDLIECMEIALGKGKMNELQSALEHKLAAINLSEEGNHIEAVNEYRRAVDVFPEGQHFKLPLALGYMSVQGYEDASKLLETILLAKPHDWEVKYYLSRCCYMLNDVDKAIDLLEDCITTNYEPRMSLLIGLCYASKGESIGKELYRKLGRFDQQKTAEMVSPYLEKAIKNFQQYSKNGEELDSQYFNQVCRMFDQLSPGRLQYMGIPLSLNRLHRVNTVIDDLPMPMMDAEFIPKEKVCSVLVGSCVRGKSSGDYTATVFLFDGDDPTQFPHGSLKPIALMTIVWDRERDPYVSISYTA